MLQYQANKNRTTFFFLYRLKSYTGHVCKSPHYIIPTKGIKKKSMDSSTYKQPIYSRSARCHTNRASYMDKTRKLAHIPEWRWHSECSRLSSKCTLGVGDIQNVADSHQNAHSKSLRSESQRQNSSSFHQPASSSKTWKNCRTVPWRQLARFLDLSQNSICYWLLHCCIHAFCVVLTHCIVKLVGKAWYYYRVAPTHSVWY